MGLACCAVTAMLLIGGLMLSDHPWLVLLDMLTG
jgi:hypothetical protein